MANAVPLEALLLSVVATVNLRGWLGGKLGWAVSLGVAVALVVWQMLRDRTYATASRLVHESGLVVRSREETELKGVVETWADGSPDLGDIVLKGDFGERRIRAVRRPYEALEALQGLIRQARGGAA